MLPKFCEVSAEKEDWQAVHSEILKRVPSPSLFTVVVEQEKAVACGLGVIHQEKFGFFDIVTKADSRRQGHGTRLLDEMLCWQLGTEPAMPMSRSWRIMLRQSTYMRKWDIAASIIMVPDQKVKLVNAFSSAHFSLFNEEATSLILTPPMPAKIYSDKDGDLKVLKNKTVAVIGFGSQGHAHALNLKESGVNVIIGLYPGSKSIATAKKYGFKVFNAAEAVKKADIIFVATPDITIASVTRRTSSPT